MANQWPRALLRAELREAGYDALAARDLDESLAYPAADAKRGPVRLVIVDQNVVDSSHESLLTQLAERLNNPPMLLLASAVAPPSNIGGRVLQRPMSIADIVRAVQASVPLSQPTAHPVD
ncbi:MAG TPA: hypothetical protein VHH32_06555 [Gemmatimonadales bacterium]|nr:hypothetical protein [Gemmatimonadales bacterium]